MHRHCPKCGAETRTLGAVKVKAYSIPYGHLGVSSSDSLPVRVTAKRRYCEACLEKFWRKAIHLDEY